MAALTELQMDRADVVSHDGPRRVVLEARGVSKVFGGTVALDHVDLALRAGEIHALVGENGAGKSTLTNLLSGVHRADTGMVLLDGAAAEFDSPASAQASSVAILHQEPAVFGHLDVAENVFVGRQPRTGILRRIDNRSMRLAAARLLTELGVGLAVTAKVADLSLAQIQMVEMAQALSLDARVVILDEPTASLTPTEVAQLFVVMRRLREHEVAILFIAHRLEEVMEIADVITVFRDGRRVLTERASGLTERDLVHAMVGRDREVEDRLRVPQLGEVRLRVHGLTRRQVFEDISFEVRAGEVLGLAGLVGAGRTEVARAVFGIDRYDAGEVEVVGHRRIRNPADAIAAGLAFVPESRQEEGVALGLSIEQNISLPLLRDLSRGTWISNKREGALAREWFERLRVRARDIGQPVRELSGGNQQKIVLAKWLATRPRVLILDEPTRGVDIGAKVEIHRLIGDLARQGLAILLISSDLPEVLALSDRLFVLRGGRVAAQFDSRDATPEAVIAAAAGGGGGGGE